MPKEEWGVKRVCPTTGKRFYDLNKKPAISPYTGDVVQTEAASKSQVMAADKEDASATAADLAKKAEEELESSDNNDLDVDLGDDVLDDDDEEEDNVPLEEIADVAGESDDS